MNERLRMHQSVSTAQSGLCSPTHVRKRPGMEGTGCVGREGACGATVLLQCTAVESGVRAEYAACKHAKEGAEEDMVDMSVG